MSYRILRCLLLISAVCLWPQPVASQTLPPSVRYGVHTITANAAEIELANAAGFDTLVQLLHWGENEPARGQFFWQQSDALVQAAQTYGLDLVLRLDHPPAWARPVPLVPDAPPVLLDEYARWVQQVATRYRGQVRGYIIWNEPNLALEWGGLPPNPAAYVQLLQVGYRAVKAGDPAALVVSAGLAPTNTQNAEALDERLYLEQLYSAGAAPFFDVLGAHAYGFGLPPDDLTGWPGGLAGLTLARLAASRAVMVRYGDQAKAVWVTELGWAVEGVDHTGGHAVTAAQQATYLTKALRESATRWPWVALITVWNLGGVDAAAWRAYSLLTADGNPRPAYQQLMTWLQPTATVRRKAPVVPSPLQLLAPDMTIHLGDARLPLPWVELYRNRNPSPVWAGDFYLVDPGVTPWRLTVRMMQSNYWSNQIWINDERLPTPMPISDFTKSWVAASWTIEPAQLRPGHNTIRVTIAQAVALIQDRRFSYDKLQIKEITLTQEQP